MLIEFNVTNFKSIQKTQTLSMVASTAAELKEENTFTPPKVPRLLRSAVIYGPNASGKSNLIEALSFMDYFVTTSSKQGQEGEGITTKPFLFNATSRNEPSEFEVIFMQDGQRYQYGFAVNQTRVLNEWLIAYPEGRPQRWYERETDPETGKDNWYFGSKFKGRKTVLQEATRNNALFLSTAVQLNNEMLRPIYNWFNHKLATIGTGGLPPARTTDMCATVEGKKKVLELLNAADLSISDIKIEMKTFDVDFLPPDMPDSLREFLKKDLDGHEIPEVKFLHPAIGMEAPIVLDEDDESIGTRKLYSLAGPWIDVLEQGRVLFVDELNNSMHPLMVRFLISLINNPKTNKNNAQLIFSTHDTSTLDNDLFRRDQVWFTEKDEDNSTRLYPLSDFTPRKGEALEKGYLQGRYGALPFIGELNF